MTAPTRRGRVVRPGAAIAATAALLLVLLLAYVMVLLPYLGDQALYALIGRDVLDGRRLYTEIWDIKQPGIFLWYGLADLLFGPSQIASRVLDVAAVLALGPVLHLMLRNRLTTPWVRRWTAAIAVVAVLLAPGSWDLGQVEMVTLAPAAAALALLAGSEYPGRARLVGAGLCLGLVAVFKLVLAAAVVVPVVVYLALAPPPCRRLRPVLVVAAASAVPVVAVAVWLGSTDSLGAALVTWFVDPVETAATPGVRNLERLLVGAGVFAIVMAPVVVLGVWQAVLTWRTRERLDTALVAWTVSGTAAVVVQFGWAYQWFLLAAPLLALAVRRLDGLAPGLPGRGGRRLAALALVCLPLVAHGARTLVWTAIDGGGLTAGSRSRIDARQGHHHLVAAELAAVPVATTDSLYVVGDPLFNLLAGLPLPLRTNGWNFWLFTPRHWDQVAAQARRARPTLILVEERAEPLVREHAPALSALLVERYTVVRDEEFGTWYRLR
ncbi:MAG: hypothetical protein LH603_17270 [Pseudonocardia sp.]|nr:hypothetical protein [Pseudonocardia sp.]